MSRTAIILPPDPFWLLRIPVAPGQQTPFHLFMLWAWQFSARPDGPPS